MIKITRSIVLILPLLFISILVQSQTLPAVPKRITMFDISLVLEENTRRTIEKEMGFLASKRSFVEAKMEKMAIYFPIIETIFEQEGIPKEFKYLCAQESSFIADAVSTSNAVGFWQFKIGTATDYGLRVDDMVDERKNIVASTKAAALYLKNNNKIYKNWVSTLLSYRLGLTGAKNQVPPDWTNASEITITNDIDWYVIRNIAHFIFFENELANFTANGSYLYLHNNVSGKSFSEIAQELASEEIDLRKENVWCKTDIIPSDKNYTLVKMVKKNQKIPTVLARESVLNKPFFDIEVGYPILKIDEKKSKKTGNTFYTINGKNGILSIKGDIPESLAERSGLKLQYLLSYNDLDKNDAVKPQMVYYLEKKNRKGKIPKHVVKKGQSIWLVSQMYGIRENRLLRMNRMKKSDALQEGRVLNLVEKRGRKDEIEFVKQPFENEQLPTERPRVIIDNSKDTFLNKISVPDKETDLTTNTAPNIFSPPIEEITIQTNNNGSPIRVIVRDLGDVKSNTTQIPVFSKPEATNSNSNFVIVNQGENLFSLAKKYNITVTALKQRNGLITNTVEIGQKLFLPTIEPNIKENTQKEISIYKNQNDNSKTKYHMVELGETLYRVSVKYGVSVDKLKQMNNLLDNTISVGQKILVSK